MWTADEAGPFQPVPYPGERRPPAGLPAHQPHEDIRDGTAKLLTPLHPASGRVRVTGVTSGTKGEYGGAVLAAGSAPASSGSVARGCQRGAGAMIESSRRLRRFTERVCDEPIFLAATLERVRRHHGWTAAELAAHLGGDEDQLARLCLCRPPRADRWAADVEQIAAHCGIEPGQLAGLLREVPQ